MILKKITKIHPYHTKQRSDSMFLLIMSKTNAQNSNSYKGTKIWSKLKLELKNVLWNAFKKQVLLVNIKSSNLLYLPIF